MPVFWRGRIVWERLVPVPKGWLQPCPRCHGAIAATGNRDCPAECLQCGEQFYVFDGSETLPIPHGKEVSTR